MTPTAKSFFMKMDLKDFFMSGMSDELIKDVIAIFDPVNEHYLRGLVAETIEVLLSSQYVAAPCLPGRLWRVIRGAGMGLIFAGDLCDVALATRAELQWAACLAIQRSHGVERFWRFRDDSLTIATDEGLANAFFQGYAQRCGYFRGGVEDISHSTVKFLDVRII